MVFFGYWSAWSLFLFFLWVIGKLKIADGSGQFSILVLLTCSFFFTIPSTIIHLAFNDLTFLMVIFGITGIVIIAKDHMVNRYKKEQLKEKVEVNAET